MSLRTRLANLTGWNCAPCGATDMNSPDHDRPATQEDQ